MDLGICIALIILCLIVGVIGGFLLRVRIYEKSFAETKKTAENIVATAEADAEKKKKELILEAKQVALAIFRL